VRDKELALVRFHPDEDATVRSDAIKGYLKKDKNEKQIRQRRSLKDFHLTKNDIAFPEYNQLFYHENGINRSK